MYRSWGTGAEKRTIYKYSDLKDRNRMGSGVRIPPEGALCLCTAHAGDCFYEYLVLKQQKDGSYKKAFRTAAYFFGKRMKKLSERKFHLICAGESVEI